MSPRHRRVFDEVAKRELLEAVGRCRKACVEASRQAPIHEPIYDAVGGLMGAIDDVAMVLTGDRRHFWIKPHSTPVRSTHADGFTD